jgi:alpha-D-xyloside xylohydrolase
VHGFDSLPLFVRPGAALPWGADTERSDSDWLAGLTLLVTRDTQEGERVVPGHDGEPAAVFRVIRADDELRVTATGTQKPFTVRELGGRATSEGVGEVVVRLDRSGQ